MLEYLDIISKELGERRATLITNARAGSSSFYASFRSLCEEFTKHALRQGRIELSEGARISLVLSRADVIEYFVSLGGTETDIEKIKNYILKINKQLHDKEKPFDTELAVKYVSALYNFTSPFAAAMGLKTTAPTAEQIKELCLSHERDIENAKADQLERDANIIEEIGDKIDDRIQKMQASIDELIAREERERERREREEAIKRKVEEDILRKEAKAKDARRREEMAREAAIRKKENEELKRNQINYIIKTAPTSLIYIKNHLPYKEAKLLLIGVTAAALFASLLYLLLELWLVKVTVFSFGMLFWQIMLLITLVKAIRSKETVSSTDAMDHFPMSFSDYMRSGQLLPLHLNAKYTVSLVLYILFLIFDYSVCYVEIDSFAYTYSKYSEIITTAFILLMIVIVALSITARILIGSYYSNYSVVVHRGRVGSGNTAVEINLFNTAGIILDEENFVKKFREGTPITFHDRKKADVRKVEVKIAQDKPKNK